MPTVEFIQIGEQHKNPEQTRFRVKYYPAMRGIDGGMGSIGELLQKTLASLQAYNIENQPVSVLTGTQIPAVLENIITAPFKDYSKKTGISVTRNSPRFCDYS